MRLKERKINNNRYLINIHKEIELTGWKKYISLLLLGIIFQ